MKKNYDRQHALKKEDKEEEVKCPVCKEDRMKKGEAMCDDCEGKYLSTTNTALY